MGDGNRSHTRFISSDSTELNLVQSKEADGTYPIEAAIRAKERHKAQQAIYPEHGKGIKKRKFDVEQHFDDCG